uniref:Centrosomal protein of 78 kDa n=1 Tax=Mesocestoides corti TaxID=53468 RepID=A0A5K3FS42_MESCO
AQIDINNRHNELTAILRSLESCSTIQTLAFRSLRHKKSSQLNSKNKKGDTKDYIKKSFVLSHPDILTDICRSILISVTANQSLCLLELQNLPLSIDDVYLVCKGIVKAKVLQYVSFENSRIGDEAVSELCNALRTAMCVTSINLTGCGITDIGVRAIASLLQFHALHRRSDIWKNSLRYQTPNFDSFGGLRRITLNDNPRVGNSGSKMLSDVLQDDMWMKAVDMQNCGLGDEAGLGWLGILRSPGAKAEADLVESGNKVINIIDLRRNRNLDRNILRSVTERVLLNSHGKQTEYKWLRALARSVNPGRVSDWPGIEGVDRLDLDAPTPPKRTSSFNRHYKPKPPPAKPKAISRPQFRPGGGAYDPKSGPRMRARSLQRRPSSQSPRRQLQRSQHSHKLRATSVSTPVTPRFSALSRSVSSRRSAGPSRNESNFNNSEAQMIPGVPWRAAARAHRVKANVDMRLGIPRSLLTTFSELDLRRIKSASASIRSTAKKTDAKPHRRISSVSNSSLSTVDKRQSGSSAKSDQTTLQRSDGHDDRLRHQLIKHMKNLDTAAKAENGKAALQHLFARIDTTLTAVEKAVQRIGDPQHQKFTSKNEEHQLQLIQLALRRMISPLRHGLGVGETVKPSQRRQNALDSQASSWRQLPKSSTLTRNVATSNSVESLVPSKSQNASQAQPSPMPRKRTSSIITCPITPQTEVAAKHRVSTQPSRNESSFDTDSSSDVFIAIPGKASRISETSYLAPLDVSRINQTQSLPDSCESANLSTHQPAVHESQVISKTRSAPSVFSRKTPPTALGTSRRRKPCSDDVQEYVDIFEDVTLSKDHLSDSQTTIKADFPECRQFGDTTNDEILLSDY